MPLLLMLAACMPADPDSSVFMGIVRSDTDVASPGLGGATLTSFDAEGAEFAQTTSNGDGSFEVAIPWGGAFAVVVSADGHVPTSMTGFGTTDTVLAPDGAVFARTDAWWEAELEAWAGCPGLEDGPVVEGILRAYLPVPGDEVDTLPVINTGQVSLDVDADTRRFPCYLDDDGAYDEDALETGDTGRFLFGNAAPGWSVVRPSFTADGATFGGIDQAVWIPESGVASLDPAFVETPGL